MPSMEDISKAYKQYYTHGPSERERVNQFASRRGAPRRLKRIRAYLKKAYYSSMDDPPLYSRVVHMLALSGIGLHPILFRQFKRASGYLSYVPNGKLLDVGCGDGLYIDYMRRLGWEVEGVEIDERAAGLSRQRGFIVHCGTLIEQKFEDNRFDAIVLSHVLEHVHDPVGLLRECHRILKTTGLIRIFIPNVDSLGHRRFKSNWIGLDPPRHLHLFTASGLRELARRAGFLATIQTNSVFSQFNWSASSFLAGSSDKANGAADLLQISFRSVLFDVHESIGLIFGKGWGEEIVLFGKKDPHTIR